MIVMILKYSQNEYPTLLMKPEEIWNVDQYQLQVKKTVPYGSWLKQSSLTISSNVSINNGSGSSF